MENMIGYKRTERNPLDRNLATDKSHCVSARRSLKSPGPRHHPCLPDTLSVSSSLQPLLYPDPFAPTPLQAVPYDPYTWAALRRGRSPGGLSKSSGGLLGGGDCG